MTMNTVHSAAAVASSMPAARAASANVSGLSASGRTDRSRNGRAAGGDGLIRKKRRIWIIRISFSQVG